MLARDFCYWLQGLFELGKPVSLDAAQTDLIKRHLSMVFVHDIDPQAPSEQQAMLNALHSGKPAPPVVASPQPKPWHPHGEPQARC